MKKINLKWRIACHGNAKGKAVFILSEDDLSKVEEGDIIIAKQTDVNYTPKMLISSGIITEGGGRYSHAAIFTRENNIPCLVGVDGIFDEVKEGDILEIDTASNILKILNDE